ncbi:MAG: hypothetical protein WKF88_00100 [Ferruginibacter sp.]
MRLIISLIAVAVFFSCNNKKDTPDVTAIPAPLKTYRFEKAFFALDTNNIMPQTDRLIAQYPSFGENFLSSILGLDPKLPADTIALYLKGFLIYNRNVYDTAEKLFSDFSPYEKQIKQALQFVKFYFPAYKVPTTIITYIGPADGYGDILDDDAFIIGLQAHLGKDFPLYKTSVVEETYPGYITARFTPDYIAVNCMKNIVTDLYPERSEDKRLIMQMIEKGKRLYLLRKFLPGTEEYRLIGYTNEQMKDAYTHEPVIWNLFTQNNLLQVTDNNLIKNYVSEGPKTQELGENAPGNIGSFAGWQIVKKYMAKNPGIQPDSLMRTDNETVFREAKYKP